MRAVCTDIMNRYYDVRRAKCKHESISNIVGAVLYLASRMQGGSMSFVDAARAIGGNEAASAKTGCKRHISKFERCIRDALNMSVPDISSTSTIESYGAKLNLGFECVRAAKEIARKSSNSCPRFSTKDATTFAAVCIYMVVYAKSLRTIVAEDNKAGGSGVVVHQHQRARECAKLASDIRLRISRATEVPGITIRNAYRIVHPIRTKLIPRSIASEEHVRDLMVDT